MKPPPSPLRKAPQEGPALSVKRAAFSMTPRRRAALALGQQIRTIAGVDASARNFDRDLAERIRAVCDEQMHRIGYESITEHMVRIHAGWYDELVKMEMPPSFYRYKKLESPNAPK